jgi:transcriptional regulator with XRE-family HTH domain
MDQIKQIIGANIRKLRKAAGLKQAELAGLLGCSRSSIAQIESGGTMATIIFVYKAVDALGCSVFDIIPGEITKRAVENNLNVLRNEAFAYAEKQGFHKRKMNLGERLMLVVSELSEALEADREGRWCPEGVLGNSEKPIIKITEFDQATVTKEFYETHIRGTVEEELADAIIRLADIAGIYGIDLDWHVSAKMAYNRTRPYMHGKKYG